jgi:NADH dehydrogenase
LTQIRPRVVIVGAGFGGLRAARRLRRSPVDVWLVDRRNYHLFQPLLYQVATAGLAPEEISRPVRAILRRQRNLHFRMHEVTGVDFDHKALLYAGGRLSYDYLILAVGASTNFFGLESVQRHGLELKDLDDAVGIRNRVLLCFEEAVGEEDTSRRRELLTFIVVGGGPTGVEMAGALSELIRLVLSRDYPRLDFGDVRIFLLEGMDRLLSGMPPELSAAASESLKRKHVEVRFGQMVEGYDGLRVALKGGEEIRARTLIWAAGAKAAPLAGHLGLPTRGAGQIAVTPSLQIPGRPEVFVIGDAAYLEIDGRPLPMMAPVATQMGQQAADNIGRLLRGEKPAPFRYSDPGSLATIGRNSAVAHVWGRKFKGFPAWVVWLLVHLIQLIGFRNRLIVLVNWAWDYFLYERAVRLITPEGITPVRGEADAKRSASNGG